MKKWLRLFSFAVTLLFIFQVFAACGNNNGGITDTTTSLNDGADSGDGKDSGTETTATGNLDDGSLAIVVGGLSEYILVRSDRSDEMVTNAMVSLNNAITSSLGLKLTLKTDWVQGVGVNDVYDSNAKEILIGETNRRESRDTVASLGPNEYVIKVVGNKLVITGDTDYSTVTAVKEFIAKCLNGKLDELIIPADFTLSGQSGVQKIPLAEGADLRIMTFNILGSGNEYETRKQYEIAAILDHLPDVVGFQEVNSTAFNGTILNKSITKYYAVNCSQHSSGTTNYTPIIYLKDKYKLVEGGVEWLDSRYTKTNTKSLSWAVLEIKETGKRFIVVNHHGALWMDTYELPAGETHQSMKNKAVEWRNDNVRQALDKIASLKAKYGDLPAVSIGDFNFNNSAAAYQIMTKQMDSAQDKATKSATKNISSLHTVGQAPGSGKAIDHVFYTPDKLEALTYVISTREGDLKASDHCPVYADLKFK